MRSASTTRAINVVHGQTDRIDTGAGAFASRVTVMCGEATRLAAVKLRDKALQLAAELMQTDAAALDIINGEIVRTGRHRPVDDRSLNWRRRGPANSAPRTLSCRRTWSIPMASTSPR